MMTIYIKMHIMWMGDVECVFFIMRGDIIALVLSSKLCVSYVPGHIFIVDIKKKLQRLSDKNNYGGKKI